MDGIADTVTLERLVSSDLDLLAPLGSRLLSANTLLGAYAGWEYPDWFAPEGVEPKVECTWGRQNWFEYAAAEHRAAREGVILMDYSVMGKLLVQGWDAEKVLNWICANNVAVPVGRCVYIQWLNERGRIEADLTVTRMAEDRYLILTGDGTITAVQARLKRNISPDAHAFVANVTSAYSVLNIQRPKSRDLLSRVSNADRSNEAFPFLTLQEIDAGYALVLALRVTYVGELGGNSISPPSFSSTSLICTWMRARTSGWYLPGCRRWKRCAWKRRIVIMGMTLTTWIRRWR